jgi:hypothetical protein
MTALEALALARAEGVSRSVSPTTVPISATDRAAKRPLTCSRTRRQTRDRRSAALARPLHPPRARACPQFPRLDGERRQRPHPARRAAEEARLAFTPTRRGMRALMAAEAFEHVATECLDAHWPGPTPASRCPHCGGAPRRRSAPTRIQAFVRTSDHNPALALLQPPLSLRCGRGGAYQKRRRGRKSRRLAPFSKPRAAQGSMDAPGRGSEERPDGQIQTSWT